METKEQIYSRLLDGFYKAYDQKLADTVSEEDPQGTPFAAIVAGVLDAVADELATRQ